MIMHSMQPHFVFVVNCCTSINELLACGYMPMVRCTNERRVTTSTLKLCKTYSTFFLLKCIDFVMVHTVLGGQYWLHDQEANR